jgi:hypothetical protein
VDLLKLGSSPKLATYETLDLMFKDETRKKNPFKKFFKVKKIAIKIIRIKYDRKN